MRADAQGRRWLTMGTYTPLISDPAQIRALDHQRFVVLRAPAPVNAELHRVRHELRASLQEQPVSYPAEAHVTLCAFSAGADLGGICEVVERWARTASPLSLETHRLGSFPAPFQIIVLEVTKTEPLLKALTQLRFEAQRHGLPVVTAIHVDDWRFHVSVAYCDQLSLDAWHRVARRVASIPAPPVRALVEFIEVVAFDDCREYLGGQFRLGPS
jgi:2'-5' RNA ligase